RRTQSEVFHAGPINPGVNSNMSDKRVTVFAIVKAKKGMEDAVGRELQALLAPTRVEKGCLNYDLHRSQTEPGSYRFYENWVCKEDLDRHLQSPHVRRFVDRADELLAEPVDISL